MTTRLVTLLVLLTIPAAAQSLLYLDNDGKLELVRRADERRAFVFEGGQWIARTGNKFVLKSTPEYLPALIAVHNPYFHRGARAISDRGPANVRLPQGGRFVFTADLECERPLDNVVLLLTLESPKLGTNSYVWGVGHMDAHRRKRVSIDEITPFKLTGIHLGAVHLFVDGHEAFNSEIPDASRAAALDRMVANRIAAVKDADLQPLFVCDPAYPATLKKKVPGRAVIGFKVNEDGRVLDPAVTSATDPAFGTEAVAAIRQWRFVPQVKGGIPVAATAEQPFEFAPPD